MTVRYEEGAAPVVDTVVIAIQHDDALIDVHGSEEAERAFVEQEVRTKVVEVAIPAACCLRITAWWSTEPVGLRTPAARTRMQA